MFRFRNSWTALFPANCPLCGTGIPADPEPNMFCAACLEKLPFIRGVPCPACGGPRSGLFDVCSDCMSLPPRPWRKAWAVFRYEEDAVKAVRLLKYGKRVELARPLGRLAAGVLPADARERYDCIVPVPLHWMRYLTRGYNQSRLLAEQISAWTKIPVRGLLKRRSNTPHQAFLSREERKQNIQGAFSFCGSTIPQNGAILLVDDVMTTGATLEEGTRVLLEAGCASVDVLVIARRQRN